ncbi:MAG: M56 family metallopeptidase [Gemmatimonadota bacterium]
MNPNPMDLLARVILLLLTAFVVSLAVRRRSASLRALVWTLALGGLLVLPALSRYSPRLRLGLLPAAAAASPAVIPADRGEHPASLTRQRDKSANTATDGQLPIETLVLENAASAINPVPPSAISWLAIAGLAWALGFLALIFRLVRSLHSIRRIVRTARVSSDTMWVGLVNQVRSDLGISRAVSIRVSDAVTVPAVTGLVRPILLLPPDSVEWNESERRQVALHEMAHVKRWDGVSQLVNHLACAVYWFVPLVWYGARHAAELRELACDDVVLNSGTRASAYAENLLKLVRLAGGVELPPSALAMARSSRIHHRLRGILDPAARREAVSGRVALTMMAVAGGMFGLIAAMDPSSPLVVDRPGVNVGPESGLTRNGASGLPASLTIGIGGGNIPVSASDSVFCNHDISSSSNSVHEDDDNNRTWTVKISGAGCKIDLRAEGKIEYNDAFTDVESISSGGYFRVDVTDRDTRRQLDIVPTNGGLERTYRVNGTEKTWDDAGRKWFADFLIDLDRRTAIAVSSRLPRLLKQGGVTAVLDETALMPSEYARSQYYTGLAETTKLSPADVQRLMDQAVRLKTSDYYQSELLNAFLKNGVEDPEMREIVVGMIESMESDYYRAQAMNTLMEKGRPTPAEMDVMLGVVGRMESSYYQSETLKQLLDLGKLTTEQRAMVAATVSKMDDDYQVSQVLKELATRGEMGPEERKAFFAALGHMDSDYYLYEIASTMLTTQTPTADETGLVIEAAGKITSDYYRGEIASDLLAIRNLTEGNLLSVVGLVRDMESDYTKGEVLQKVLHHTTTNAKVRQAVLDAAGSLGDYYRGEVRRAAGTGEI